MFDFVVVGVRLEDVFVKELVVRDLVSEEVDRVLVKLDEVKEVVESVLLRLDEVWEVVELVAVCVSVELVNVAVSEVELVWLSVVVLVPRKNEIASKHQSGQVLL